MYSVRADLLTAAKTSYDEDYDDDDDVLKSMKDEREKERSDAMISWPKSRRRRYITFGHCD